MPHENIENANSEEDMPSIDKNNEHDLPNSPNLPNMSLGFLTSGSTMLLRGIPGSIADSDQDSSKIYNCSIRELFRKH